MIILRHFLKPSRPLGKSEDCLAQAGRLSFCSCDSVRPCLCPPPVTRRPISSLCTRRVSVLRERTLGFLPTTNARARYSLPFAPPAHSSPSGFYTAAVKSKDGLPAVARSSASAVVGFTPPSPFLWNAEILALALLQRTASPMT